MDHISCHTYNILYYYNCSQFKYFIQINLLATTVPLLHVLSPRVVLQTHLAPGDVLVTHMLQRFPPSSFTLFVALASTSLRVVQPADFRQLLLPVGSTLLLLHLLRRLSGDPPLASLVRPDMGKLVRG